GAGACDMRTSPFSRGKVHGTRCRARIHDSACDVSAGAIGGPKRGALRSYPAASSAFWPGRQYTNVILRPQAREAYLCVAVAKKLSPAIRGRNRPQRVDPPLAAVNALEVLNRFLQAFSQCHSGLPFQNALGLADVRTALLGIVLRQR